MAELVLSASSVEAYRSCHWRWYLQYVEGFLGEQSIEAAVGLAVHAGVEHYYKVRLEDPADAIGIDTPAAVATGLEAYELNFFLETASIPDFDPKMRAIGERVYRAYVEDVGGQVVPLLVEHAGRLTVNGVEYSYHIDLVDSEGVVRDLKVKKAKPRDPARYAFQMNGYALAYRLETGKVERDVQLDVMIRLKRDRPYHVPISNGGPVSDDAIGIFAATLESAANGIAKADYRPTGLETGECRYCPVRSECEYYAALSLSKEQDNGPSNDDDYLWFAQHGNDSGGHGDWGTD